MYERERPGIRRLPRLPRRRRFSIYSEKSNKRVREREREEGETGRKREKSKSKGERNRKKRGWTEQKAHVNYG